MFDLGGMAQQVLQGINPVLGGGDQLWAIAPRHIEAGVSVSRASRDNRNATQTARRGEPYGNGSFMRRSGSVAIVPIMGPLVARMHYAYWSYDEVIRDIRMAAEDGTIDAILLDIDSPGGMVANVEAATAAIREAASLKPMTAHVGGIGASAAYWLAAAAGDVSAAPSSLVGSVGCLIRYLDIEGIFTRLGARVVEVVAEHSPNKRLDPNSEEGRAELQAIADDGGEMFLEGLMSSRGVSRETLLEKYGQGMVFPARAALGRGMIDRIESFEESLAGLAARAGEPNRAATATATPSQETIMAQKDPGTAAEAAAKPVTVESLRADHGDLVATIEAEASAKASADAANAERERILGIEANALAGHDALVAEMKADGKTTPAEAAVRILAAEKEKAKARTSALEALDAAAIGVVSTPSGGEGPAAFGPEGWAAAWESDPKLKAEYPTAAAYVAIMKREQASA